MKDFVNPILTPRVQLQQNMAKVQKSVHASRLREKRRKIKDMCRYRNAREALEEFDKQTEIFGVTLGKFSVIELLTELLEITGPADEMIVCTWTVGKKDITNFGELIAAGKIKRLRFICDSTFYARQPEMFSKLQTTLGRENIRAVANHAKFATIQNAAWNVVVHTSMNLNRNYKMENFTVYDAPDMMEFLTAMTDDIFRDIPADFHLTHTPYETDKHFRELYDTEPEPDTDSDDSPDE